MRIFRIWTFHFFTVFLFSIASTKRFLWEANWSQVRELNVATKQIGSSGASNFKTENLKSTLILSVRFAED